MRLNLAVWLLGAGVLANAHALNVGHDQSPAHLLHARNAEPGFIGDILGGLLGGLSGSSKRCPTTFVCNGKGNDGYECVVPFPLFLRAKLTTNFSLLSYDIYGNSRPSWAPSGWQYFGLTIGWAPSSTWSCSSSFELPTVFLSSCSKVKWWGTYCFLKLPASYLH
jgi:hypothetical protein